MATIVDARGLSCPQPVLITIAEIQKGSDPEIEVLVDTETSKENVSRAALSKGCAVTNIVEEDNFFKIQIKKS